MSTGLISCRTMPRMFLAFVALAIQQCKGTSGRCSGDPCNDLEMCRSKSGFCGVGAPWCNAESIWTADCNTPAPSTTTMTTFVAVGREIHSGDAVLLKVQGGSGNHVEVEGEAVQARWDDRGAWQMLVVEKKDGAGVIHAGDAITLRAHTGKRVDVQGDTVRARWNDDGLWQTLTVVKAEDGPIHANDVICLRAHTGKHIGFEDHLAHARFDECGALQLIELELVEARPIHSGDKIFLKAHTGAYIHVEQAGVRAAWNEKGDWQALTLESHEGHSIFSGDTVFLNSHTGNHIEVSPDGVGCHWNDHGTWQSLTIQKHNGGAIFPGDTVFLQAHTGKHIDVEGDQVRARWNDHGAWQSLVLEQNAEDPASTTTLAVHTTTTTTSAFFPASTTTLGIHTTATTTSAFFPASTTLAVDTTVTITSEFFPASTTTFAVHTTVTTTSAFLARTTTTTTATGLMDRCSAENTGCPDPNGKGISAWFTKAMFNDMFPQICNPSCKGCNLLTYNCLIQATLLYPDFANSGSDVDNKRELAAWLGIMSQETTGGGCSLSQENSDGTCTCGPMWCDNHPNGGCEAWGLCFFGEETADRYCDSASTHYPCVAGKKYSGRGPKQLSWNANYGQFSEEFCGDKNLLLNHPERVATNPTLAWASSIWFWFSGGACVPETGEKCKPGCHDVLLGSKTKCPADFQAGRQYGLGWVTNVVNGGLECGSAGQGKCDFRVHSRVKYYKRFCSMLGINPLAPGWTDDSNLFCSHQKNYRESPPTEC